MRTGAGRLPTESSALNPRYPPFLHRGIPLATFWDRFVSSAAFAILGLTLGLRHRREAPDCTQRTARFLRRTATTTPATAIAITTAVAPKNTGGSSPKIVTAGAGVGASSMSMSTALWNVNVM